MKREHLEYLRRTGNLPAQRRHAWDVIAQLTKPGNHGGQPEFESWFGEGTTFATEPVPAGPRGIRGFSRAVPDPDPKASSTFLSAPSADVPVLTYTLYNQPAFRHIRRLGLYRQDTLMRLRQTGPADSEIPQNRSVPSFPPQAIVLKTTWWPVARHGITALPVWDPARNSPRAAGNDYTSWARAVAVDPARQSKLKRTASIDFAGRTVPDALRVGLHAFYHVTVTPSMARNLSLDPSAQKVSLISLGRPIQAGDYLALVGADFATKEIRNWVWGALWWHDQASSGAYAANRPATLRSPWRNYLLDVAFDSDKPVSADGGPHVCFNPWLEGRFPDGGHGDGALSNCLACHRRASFPAVDFLPVTRGRAEPANDPAYGPGRIRTNFLWSLALHARR